jgi:deoxycytidylate deaminase
MVIPDFRILSGNEALEAMRFIEEAAETAQGSLCKRSKCGSVIVQNGETIGRGFNTPPQYKPDFCTCLNRYETPARFVYDRTCRIHAEQEAIRNAERQHADKVVGGRLYYAGLDGAGKLKPSRKPKCTVCSRLSLHVGLAEFVLYREDGIYVYSTPYYDRLSWEFVGQ